MSRKLKFERKIIKSSLSHIVLLKNNCLCFKMCCFLVTEKCSRLAVCWTLSITTNYARHAVLCDTEQQQFTWWYSCGSHLVRSVGFSQLTVWLAAPWCGLVVMCNVQHFVTNHTESQFLRNKEQHCLLPSLVDDFTCVHSKNALLNHILSTLFSSTSVLFSCTPFGTKLSWLYIIY